VFPAVVVVPGAMISPVVVSLPVYGMRMLMLRVQEQQQAQNALLAGVLSELPFPVVVAGARGDVVLANPAVIELIGWRGPGVPQLGELRLEDLDELLAGLALTCGPLPASGTVGVAVTDGSHTPDRVMERADAAMYLLKPPSRRTVRTRQGSRRRQRA
jgi:hypothetical protein